MRPFTKCLMLTAVLAGCDAAANPLEPASTDSSKPSLVIADPQPRVPERSVVRELFSFVLDNPCNGELVQITIESVHTFQGVTTDPGSGFFIHWTDFIHESGTGLGESGTEYLFNVTDKVVFESPSGPAPQVTVTSYQTVLFVSQGSSPNFTLRERFHITVLPDGTFKVTSDVESGECRG